MLGGLNPYGYVHNPLSWVDPLGLVGLADYNGLKAEAGLLGSKKYGINWKEGPARAVKENKPQGQFGSVDDVNFAVQKASTLPKGQSGYFDLPEGHTSVVHLPDGRTVLATRVWVRHNKNVCDCTWISSGVNMNIYFQISNPKINQIELHEKVSLSDVIEDIFPMETEDLILVWNGIRVALSYKYDVSVILEDIIDMLNDIISKPQGELSIEWPSNTFRTTWHLIWANEVLECSTHWESTLGFAEELLNKKSHLACDKNHFICEWLLVIKKIKDSLINSGVNLNYVHRMDNIDNLLIDLNYIGYLYK